MSELITSLRKMSVNGNRLELPSEQLANYAEVKKALQKAGGKYVKCGFVFPTDPQTILDRLCGGEKVNDKKKFQAFFTPKDLAKTMAVLANSRLLGRVPKTLLEPSAGGGALVAAMKDLHPEIFVTAVEVNPEFTPDLRNMCDQVIEADFLECQVGELGRFETLGLFDCILANPPFTKNQDIQHVRHMYDFLAEHGSMVVITSTSWLKGSQKIQVAFREWLETIDYGYEEIEAGAFKESGTNVATLMLFIDK